MAFFTPKGPAKPSSAPDRRDPAFDPDKTMGKRARDKSTDPADTRDSEQQPEPDAAPDDIDLPQRSDVSALFAKGSNGMDVATGELSDSEFL